MKIAVVGSRTFKDSKFVAEIISWEFNPSTLNVFVSGGAIGVDSLAEGVINFLNTEIRPTKPIEKIIYYPDWNKHGKKAGFLRNQQIVGEADRLIAFWDGESKGTKHSIDLAVKKGIPVDIYIRK